MSSAEPVMVSIYRAIGFILALVFSVGTVPSQAADVKAPSGWLGQVDVAGKRFAWPGSGFELHFTGTHAEVILSDNGTNYLTVETDGAPVTLRLLAGTKNYVLASRLPPGRHQIRVMRRTEGLFGATSFVAASTDGKFLKGASKADKMLIIGDSISAGYGIEGASRNCRFSNDTENHHSTYGAIFARNMGLQLTTLAISGRGLSQNYDGSKKETLPSVLDRALPMQPLPASEIRSAAGNALIVVHLGTNDFSNGKRPDTFAHDYKALLGRLRAVSPQAKIVLAIGPMLSGADAAAAQAAIKAVVLGQQSIGDRAVHLLVFEPRSGGHGCDWHPNLAAHRDMADQLSKIWTQIAMKPI